MRRNRFGVFAFLLLAGGTVLLSGCGSGGSSSSGDSSSTTKSAYIAAADKVCLTAAKTAVPLSTQQTALNTALASATSNAGASKAAAQIANLLDKYADVRGSVSAELSDLAAPDSGAADAYLSAREASTKATRAEAEAYRAYSKNPSEATTAQIDKANKAAVKADARGQTTAKAYGFKVCATPAKAN